MRVRLCVHACVCVLLMLLLLLVLFWVVSHCYGDRRRLSTVRSFVTTRRSRKSSHDSRPSSTNVGEHAGSCGGMYVASLCVDHLSRRQIWSCACSLGSWPCSVPRSRWHRSLHSSTTCWRVDWMPTSSWYTVVLLQRTPPASACGSSSCRWRAPALAAQLRVSADVAVLFVRCCPC